MHLICVHTDNEYVDTGRGVQLVGPAPALPQAVVHASLVASFPLTFAPAAAAHELSDKVPSKHLVTHTALLLVHQGHQASVGTRPFRS